MWGQFLICRAAKRSIGLERKVLAREATGLPCGTHLLSGHSQKQERCVMEGVGEQEQTRDRADWVRMKLMPQFESQVPDPLGDQLPALLSPG
jgi:hypothetical protein